jgi:glycine/D-amino acid oxidase-like deaminating enzyme
MERLDGGATRLRTGASVWQAGDGTTRGEIRRFEPRHLVTDVAIVGAGITGAFLAERLTRCGRRVVMIDRRQPAHGSTAASTAMLLWELDASLLELEDRLGFASAARIALRCRRAVGQIANLVAALKIDCDFRPRHSLYLTGSKLDASDLRHEHELRQRVGIDGRYLEQGALEQCGFVADGALLYPGSAEADPVRLSLGLIAASCARGAVVLSPATAISYQTSLDGVVVETCEGDIVRAGTLILANGYEIPDFIDASRHQLLSSWAIASTTASPARWRGGLLVWESADPYLYLRSTADGRIVVGGEDEKAAGPTQRDRLMDEKVGALKQHAEYRRPGLGSLEIEYGWAGVFGQTADSLPMIGPVPGKPNCMAAFGYGGNGITFSAIAADHLGAALSGKGSEGSSDFALDRN